MIFYNAVKMILIRLSLFSHLRRLISSVIPVPPKGGHHDMPLSNREVTVLRYLANGMSNKEIAEQLFIE